MSKITNDSLTRWRSGTQCFITLPIWQQWASKGRSYQTVSRTGSQFLKS